MKLKMRLKIKKWEYEEDMEIQDYFVHQKKELESTMNK